MMQPELPVRRCTWRTNSAPPMRERGRGGHDLSRSSLAAMAGCAWMSIYPATKAFDQVLAKACGTI